MLTREESLAVCETVLAHAKAAGAEDAIVSVQSSAESHARFADNRVTTSGRAESIAPSRASIAASSAVVVANSSRSETSWHPRCRAMSL